MIGGLVRAMAGGARRVTLRPRACLLHLPVVTSRTGCDACERACPRGAIRAGSPSADADLCDGCGLCVARCPTRALRGLEDRPGPVLASLDAVKGGEPFRIACGLAERDPGPAGTRCVCHASLGWEELVLPILAGAPAVELRSGECGTCRFHDFVAANLPGRLEFAASFARALGVAAEFVVSRSLDEAAGGPDGARISDPVRDRRLSRREMFSRWFGGGRAAVATPDPSGQVAPLPAGPVGTRDAIAALIERRFLDTEPMRIGGAGFAAVVVVDSGRCRLCGLCEATCPTGALAHKRDGGGWTRLFFEHRCVACGACVRACGHDAIRLEHDIVPGRWTSSEGRVIANGAFSRCRYCGAEALSPDLGVCAACYRTRRLNLGLRPARWPPGPVRDRTRSESSAPGTGASARGG